jgi:DNA-binding response OmpR family regulator
MKVLVVDDDRDMVLSLTSLLGTEGYETRGIYGAAEILKHVREFKPDVIFLDIAMPGRSGWEAAAAIRESFPDRRLVLVGVSGEYTSGADRSVSEMRGFDFYLMKPCDPHVLLTLLRWVGIQSPYRAALAR